MKPVTRRGRWITNQWDVNAGGLRSAPAVQRHLDDAERAEDHGRGKPDNGSPPLTDALSELRGGDLVCWCRPLPCHGDVLLRLANE